MSDLFLIIRFITFFREVADEAGLATLDYAGRSQTLRGGGLWARTERVLWGGVRGPCGWGTGTALWWGLYGLFLIRFIIILRVVADEAGLAALDQPGNACALRGRDPWDGARCPRRALWGGGACRGRRRCGLAVGNVLFGGCADARRRPWGLGTAALCGGTGHALWGGSAGGQLISCGLRTVRGQQVGRGVCSTNGALHVGHIEGLRRRLAPQLRSTWVTCMLEEAIGGLAFAAGGGR
mmetsp:Transcript_95291/g.164443  ORF Transcript_95291/g.164443 Transcript_95291/m.164443 type:complete len:238 (-) Transcript_95291:1962-2675(-)